ncbi:Hypothetical protein FKW44_015165 [Caligus rogercresseyi]|uniref:Uncharacterized protein n=1 Tax=Caligus rogercresseyi TaxID=217165 RepID=A0A7T8K0Z6_CALRO|nr:Hypothetical protein FKW44_015165 [Caligus rogercresseyi]
MSNCEVAPHPWGSLCLPWATQNALLEGSSPSNKTHSPTSFYSAAPSQAPSSKSPRPSRRPPTSSNSCKPESRPLSGHAQVHASILSGGTR